MIMRSGSSTGLSTKHKSSGSIQLSPDEKVVTAVSFLSDVAQKNYRPEDLRKYLQNKRGLSNAQINEAFRLHRLHQKRNNSPLESGEVPPGVSGAQTSGLRRSRLNTRPEKISITNSKWGSAERKEQSTRAQGSKDSIKESVLVLVQSKQAEGYELLHNFLQSEQEYCSILECLENDYRKGLSRLSETGKIKMTPKEVQDMFKRIPDLFKFHRAFHEELSKGRNVGLLFVRYFSAFKGYIEYMKDCKVSVDIVRKHLRDKPLHKQLALIRQRSRRKTDDMVDLLLVPLDRITECKTFLDKMCEWADSEQNDNFSNLSKANRRIGRISVHIEKYKYGISNRNEMNKVQQFLEKQCDIISPNRIIIRRGTMIRRTTGWAARNKNYVFFLFNDVLLWTTQNRELQNIVQLVNCTVMPSDSKTSPERKFKIVSEGHKTKILLLECNSKRQRDDWYQAAEKNIEGAKNVVNNRTTKNHKIHTSEEDESKSLPEALPQSIVPGAPGESKESQPGKPSNGIQKLSDLAITHPGTPLASTPGTPARSQPGTPGRSQPETPVEFAAFNEEESYNYNAQWLKDFDPFDDNASQISEHEWDLPAKENDKSTANILSPFMKKASDLSSEKEQRKPSRGNNKAEDDQNQIPIRKDSHTIEKIFRNDGKEDDRNKQESKDNYSSRRVNIVRRSKKGTLVESQHIRKPSFTLRLNDL